MYTMLKGEKERVNLYISADVHRRLKATLAMRGESMSGWFELMARRAIDAAAIVPFAQKGDGSSSSS